MVTQETTINKKPLSDLGADLLSGAYAALLSPPALKDFVENDDPLKNGTEVLVPVTPVVKERDVTLTFLIKGSDKSSFFTNYNNFIAELKKGLIVLSVPDLGRSFRLLYSNSTQFENYRLNACKLAVKFREPNPANQTVE